MWRFSPLFYAVNLFTWPSASSTHSFSQDI